MQRLLSIALSCLFAVTLSAQEPSITYPYNPDSNTDSLIGASDLVDFLPFYGEEFTPEPLTIEGMSLEEWMEQQSSSSGGGCDIKFPDGIDGEPLSYHLTNGYYTVPENKTYYITSLYNMSSTNLMIDSVIIGLTKWNDSSSQSSGLSLSNPLIVGSGQTISYGYGNATALNGFLISEFVEPITYGVYNSDYVVPENKTLYITQAITSGWDIKIDGIQIIGRFFNNDGNGVGITLDNPVIVKEGQIISSYETDLNVAAFNGYLVDEDYFADCGGGGGVDISGLQEQIDAVAADSYAADAALLTASDNADDELQAQIDEAVSNIQEQLDSALAINEDLQEQLDSLYNAEELIFDNITPFTTIDTPQDITLGELAYWEATDLSLPSTFEITIPEGKNLYIEDTGYNDIQEVKLNRDGVIYNLGNNVSILDKIIFTENDIISVYLYSVNSSFDILGYLVDVETSITPIVVVLDAQSQLTYTVPYGNKLRASEATGNNVCGIDIELVNDSGAYYQGVNSIPSVPFYNSGTTLSPCFDHENGILYIVGYLW